MTRRDWMLSVGNATAGLGLIGIEGAPTKDTRELPLGLYAPSTNHLGHALKSERFHAIPPGCPTDYVRPLEAPFKPQFFSMPEFSVIRRITQLLLGEGEDGTAGPGTGNVAEQVAEWTDLVVFSSAEVREAAQHLNPLHRALTTAYLGSTEMRELETADPQKICREGLSWLTDSARSKYDHPDFVSLPADAQTAILESISDKRADRSSENPGTRLFVLLKTETIRGFYTSQAGLKEMDYKGNRFYAQSPGCNMWHKHETPK